MKLNLPGLWKSKLPSGNVRWRCRVEGNKRKHITLTVTPDHPDFMEIYRAARAGVKLDPRSAPADRAIRHSVAWLTHTYLAHLQDMVQAGQASPLTYKQRANYLALLRGHVSTSGNSQGQEFADLHMLIPTHELIAWRDSYAATSGKADNMVKAARAMYQWAMSRGIVDQNPATGIGKIHKSQGGAVPWTVADLTRYREKHPPGSQAHLAITLFMFTACRIADAVVLGRANEVRKGGDMWLDWQPGKRGSAPVSIPIAAPLERAIRAQAVIGPRYLLNSHGQPWASPDSFRNRFADWCEEAGLKNRSAHGIRKAAAHLLAQSGASQFEIMTIHGHTQAKTSEIYTRAVDRQRMAQAALQRMSSIDW